eukprot:TRINITY_DN3430_c0_g1_i13.p1 TRINITY_DN3430_c0_g1~~TRINITY_DN3430_c0_g1_i13.p1  ORF type:complete len:1696 (-),score=336.35 TRINITY_DN3430_c0_g1_i13:71-5158(-)
MDASAVSSSQRRERLEIPRPSTSKRQRLSDDDLFPSGFKEGSSALGGGSPGSLPKEVNSDADTDDSSECLGEPIEEEDPESAVGDGRREVDLGPLWKEALARVNAAKAVISGLTGCNVELLRPFPPQPKVLVDLNEEKLEDERTVLESPVDVEHRENVADEDGPGVYRVVYDQTGVCATLAPGKIFHMLQVGMIVNILEVKVLPVECRVRGRLEQPAGWISLKDTSTGHRWASREDWPGVYHVVYDQTGVGYTAKPDKIFTMLSVGAVVNVVEVVGRLQEQRVRGRLENPSGWISLLDTASGHRWAQRQGDLPSRQPAVLPRPLPKKKRTSNGVWAEAGLRLVITGDPEIVPCAAQVAERLCASTKRDDGRMTDALADLPQEVRAKLAAVTGKALPDMVKRVSPSLQGRSGASLQNIHEVSGASRLVAGGGEDVASEPRLGQAKRRFSLEREDIDGRPFVAVVGPEDRVDVAVLEVKKLNSRSNNQPASKASAIAAPTVAPTAAQTGAPSVGPHQPPEVVAQQPSASRLSQLCIPPRPAAVAMEGRMSFVPPPPAAVQSQLPSRPFSPPPSQQTYAQPPQPNYAPPQCAAAAGGRMSYVPPPPPVAVAPGVAELGYGRPNFGAAGRMSFVPPAGVAEKAAGYVQPPPGGHVARPPAAFPPPHAGGPLTVKPPAYTPPNPTGVQVHKPPGYTPPAAGGVHMGQNSRLSFIPPPPPATNRMSYVPPPLAATGGVVGRPLANPLAASTMPEAKPPPPPPPAIQHEKLPPPPPPALDAPRVGVAIMEHPLELPAAKRAIVVGYRGMTLDKIREATGVQVLRPVADVKPGASTFTIVMSGTRSTVEACLTMLRRVLKDDVSGIGMAREIISLEHTDVSRLVSSNGKALEYMQDTLSICMALQQSPFHLVVTGVPRQLPAAKIFVLSFLGLLDLVPEEVRQRMLGARPPGVTGPEEMQLVQSGLAKRSMELLVGVTTHPSAHIAEVLGLGGRRFKGVLSGPTNGRINPCIQCAPLRRIFADVMVYPHQVGACQIGEEVSFILRLPAPTSPPHAFGEDLRPASRAPGAYSPPDLAAFAAAAVPKGTGGKLPPPPPPGRSGVVVGCQRPAVSALTSKSAGEAVATPATALVPTAPTSGASCKATAEVWEKRLDGPTGRVYYWEHRREEASWVVPVASDGIWESVLDPVTSRHYFFNSLTGESQWKLNLDPPEPESEAKVAVHIEAALQTAQPKRALPPAPRVPGKKDVTTPKAQSPVADSAAPSSAENTKPEDVGISFSGFTGPRKVGAKAKAKATARAKVKAKASKPSTRRAGTPPGKHPLTPTAKWAPPGAGQSAVAPAKAYSRIPARGWNPFAEAEEAAEEAEAAAREAEAASEESDAASESSEEQETQKPEAGAYMEDFSVGGLSAQMPLYASEAEKNLLDEESQDEDSGERLLPPRWGGKGKGKGKLKSKGRLKGKGKRRFVNEEEQDDAEETEFEEDEPEETAYVGPIDEAQDLAPPEPPKRPVFKFPRKNPPKKEPEVDDEALAPAEPPKRPVFKFPRKNPPKKEPEVDDEALAPAEPPKRPVFKFPRLSKNPPEEEPEVDDEAERRRLARQLRSMRMHMQAGSEESDDRENDAKDPEEDLDASDELKQSAPWRQTRPSRELLSSGRLQPREPSLPPPPRRLAPSSSVASWRDGTGSSSSRKPAAAKWSGHGRPYR